MRLTDRRRLIPYAVAATLTLAAAYAPAEASVITDWAFDSLPITSTDNTPAPTSDTTGSASASIIGMNGGPEGDITNESGAPGNTNVWRVRGTGSNGWLTTAAQYTQGAQFLVSTAGQTGISLSFDMAASNNGIEGLEVQYTTDGSDWINLDAITLSTTYTPYNVSLAAIAGAANDASFGIRLVSEFGLREWRGKLAHLGRSGRRHGHCRAGAAAGVAADAPVGVRRSRPVAARPEGHPARLTSSSSLSYREASRGAVIAFTDAASSAEMRIRGFS
jgi:hypothetical protein